MQLARAAKDLGSHEDQSIQVGTERVILYEVILWALGVPSFFFGGWVRTSELFQTDQHLVWYVSIFLNSSSLEPLPNHESYLSLVLTHNHSIVLLYKGSVGHLILFVTGIGHVKLPRQNREGSSLRD